MIAPTSTTSPALDPSALSVGDPLPPLVVRPTTVDLFRFSAATWNAHRIHFDIEYARSEGYPGVLVQSHLHGAYFLRAATEWCDGEVQVREIRWENRAPAYADAELTVTSAISALERDAEWAVISSDIEEHDEVGTRVAVGSAVVAVRLDRRPVRRPEGGAR